MLHIHTVFDWHFFFLLNFLENDIVLDWGLLNATPHTYTQTTDLHTQKQTKLSIPYDTKLYAKTPRLLVWTSKSTHKKYTTHIVKGWASDPP